MFINNFMNLANEKQLKVYLAGIYFAKDSGNRSSNIDIAKLLGISPEEVAEAWRFWKGLGVVDFYSPSESLNPSSSDYIFDVEFLSLRDKYLESNYVLKTSRMASSSREEGYTKILQQKSMLDLFNRVEQISNSPLNVDERIKIVDMLSNSSINPDMFLKAVRITYVDRPPSKPSMNYVMGIISKWKTKGLKNVDQVEREEALYRERAEFYKDVYYHLMGRIDNVTEAQVEIIDECLEHSDKDFVVALADACSIWYKIPSFKRLKTMYENVKNGYTLDRDGIDKYMASKTGKSYAKSNKNSSSAKKRAENFKQDTYSKMTVEDGIKTMRSRNPALNNRGGANAK